MKAFRAWHVPPAFTITGDEISELEEGRVDRPGDRALSPGVGPMPPVRYAALRDGAVSYTHLTLPTRSCQCRSRWAADH